MRHGPRTRWRDRRTALARPRTRRALHRAGAPAPPRRAPGARLRAGRALPELVRASASSMGSLYRVLRALEEDGLVSSEWDATSPGPAKRSYEITAGGPRAARRTGSRRCAAAGRDRRFLERYEKGGEHARTSSIAVAGRTAFRRGRLPSRRERARAARELPARPRAGARRRLRPDRASARATPSRRADRDADGVTSGSPEPDVAARPRRAS